MKVYNMVVVEAVFNIRRTNNEKTCIKEKDEAGIRQCVTDDV